MDRLNLTLNSIAESNFDNIDEEIHRGTSNTAEIEQKSGPVELPDVRLANEPIDLPENKPAKEKIEHFTGIFNKFKLETCLDKETSRECIEPPKLENQEIGPLPDKLILDFETLLLASRINGPAQRPMQMKPATQPSSAKPTPSPTKSLSKPAKASVEAPAIKPTITSTPLVSQVEAGVFVSKYNGWTGLDTQALGKELAFHLISPQHADKEIVAATLIYVNKNNGTSIANQVAKEIVDNIKSDGLLKTVGQNLEGSKTLNLIRAYLNINGTNGNEVQLARVSKALLSITPSIGGTGNDANGILSQYKPSGASIVTANQDRLSLTGVEASQKMAATDRGRVLAYRQQFIEVGRRYNIPPAILAGIASRETRGGSGLRKDGYGKDGNGYGLLQVDQRYLTPKGGPTSLEHIDQAGKILDQYRQQVKTAHPDWTEAQVLRGAIAAYNFGPDNVRTLERLDAGTTGNDYSTDVWARAQYYAPFLSNTAQPNSSLLNSPKFTPANSNGWVSSASTKVSAQPRELADSEIPKRGNSEIRYELPVRGEGYVTYNRNDTKRNYEASDGIAPELIGKRMPDQIGTKDTIEKLQTLAKEWNKFHPDRPIQIGDISLPGGVNTPDHDTHESGQNIDVRPLRNDRNLGPLDRWSPAYDQQLNIEFIEFIRSKYPNTKFYFNDPNVINKFPSGVVTKKPKHNDHIHIIFSSKDERK